MSGIAAQEKPAQPATTSAQALRKALDYFARTQQADGGWDTKDAFEGYLIVPGSNRRDHYRAIDTRLFVAAMVSLGFIGDGTTFQEGPYAAHLKKAAAFIKTGIGNADFGKSNHGAFTIPFIALYYSEILTHPGLANDSEKAEIRKLLETVVAAIVKGQKKTNGAWGYGLAEDGERHKEPAACASLMGLLAARDAGVDVPKETINRGVAFVKGCAVPSRGDFAYQERNQAPNNYGGYARTAGALYLLDRLGEEKSDMFVKGYQWLKKQHPLKDMEGHKGSFVPWAYFFGTALMSRREAAERDAWYATMHADMISGKNVENENQKEDGTWFRRSAHGCLTYKTGMRMLALAIAAGKLEIFKPLAPEPKKE